MNYDQILLLEDAIITPTKPDCKGSSGAVYDSRGILCEISQRNSDDLFRNNNPAALESLPANDPITEPAVYMGHIALHYGHFLLESLSRFYALLKDRLPPGVKYLVFNKWILPDFLLPYGKSPIINNTLEAFGYTFQNIIIIEQITKFSKLYVPYPSFLYRQSLVGYDIKYQKEVYAHLLSYAKRKQELSIDGKQVLSKRLFLSRPSWCRRLKNHSELEKLFVSRGFTPLSGKDYSFFDQILLYNNAEIIAGVEGTGTHNSVFMEPGKYLINIGSSRFPSALPPIQTVLDTLNNTRSFHIPFAGKQDQPIDIESTKILLDQYLDTIATAG